MADIDDMPSTTGAPLPTPASAPSGVRVEVSDVWKVFPGTDRTVTALAEVDVDIAAGEFVSVVGPSGCGKSTLLAIIAGLEKPSRGSVRIGGREVTAPYTDAGIVFQRDLLLEWRNCLDNVLLQFEMRGERVRQEQRDRARDLLAMVGVEDFARERPRKLSGGMRQRVSICRALAHDPQLLLMDEPFGALDAFTREQLNAELARISTQAQKTVIFITHSIPEAVYLGDRVITMSPRPGHVIAEHRVDVPRPRLPEFRESPEFADKVHEIRGLLRTEGVL